MRPWIKLSLWIFLFADFTTVLFLGLSQTPVAAQQPTGSIPTVTGTPAGPIVTVSNPEQINVRSGPDSNEYNAIGILLPDEIVPALGKSSGGDWIEIAYPGVPGGVGWVYAPLVSLSPGFLPIIEPPPTPTPRTTPTLDPTLEAAFEVPLTPTRLPTFTSPPPLLIPTFTGGVTTRSGVPFGLVIVGLAIIGIFGAVISYLRSR
jgi:hypothetical protein